MYLRRAISSLICLVCLYAESGDKRTYGKPLTIKEETLVSQILNNPAKFKGKKVKVRGQITNVCEERGCYINIKGDKKFQELMFKVDEGTMVFPANSLGREVVAEGLVTVFTVSVKEQKEMCPIEAKALNRKFDPDNIKGPLTVVRIDGIGAEIGN